MSEVDTFKDEVFDEFRQLMDDQLSHMRRNALFGVDVGGGKDITVFSEFEVDPNAPRGVRYVTSWIVDDSIIDSTAKVIE